MGHWGVRSHENDDAADALDAGFERVHGARYEELMEDRNKLSFEEVQASLANAETLAASVDFLAGEFGADLGDWDDESRLAFVGVVVRHAETGLPIPAELRDRAIAWLESEAIDWDEASLRKLRKARELETLRKSRDPA